MTRPVIPPPGSGMPKNVEFAGGWCGLLWCRGGLGRRGLVLVVVGEDFREFCGRLARRG